MKKILNKFHTIGSYHSSTNTRFGLPTSETKACEQDKIKNLNFLTNVLYFFFFQLILASSSFLHMSNG
jgi:hypothetical protein